MQVTVFPNDDLRRIYIAELIRAAIACLSAAKIFYTGQLCPEPLALEREEAFKAIDECQKSLLAIEEQFAVTSSIILI